jgi:hypothetical protein
LRREPLVQLGLNEVAKGFAITLAAGTMLA